MTPIALFPTPTLAAIVTGFVIVAIPVLILMTVWSCVTLLRVLFPVRQLPAVPVTLQEPRRDLASSVRFRDLLEDQRHAQAPAMPAGRHGPVPSPLADDLWLRRN